MDTEIKELVIPKDGTKYTVSIFREISLSKISLPEPRKREEKKISSNTVYLHFIYSDSLATRTIISMKLHPNLRIV